MNFLNNIFKGDNDEILFFILVFLFLFNGNLLGSLGLNSHSIDDLSDNGSMLFFIIVFILLFVSGDTNNRED